MGRLTEYFDLMDHLTWPHADTLRTYKHITPEFYRVEWKERRNLTKSAENSRIAKETGYRLRVSRAFREMSQDALSEKAGVSCASIISIERGLQSPRVSTLQRLLGALEMDEAAFYAIKEPPRVTTTTTSNEHSGTPATAKQPGAGPSADE